MVGLVVEEVGMGVEVAPYSWGAVLPQNMLVKQQFGQKFLVSIFFTFWSYRKDIGPKKVWSQKMLVKVKAIKENS